MMEEATAEVGLGVVLVAVCECDVAPVLAEIGGRARVEVVRLSAELTETEVEALVARVNWRRLAIRAEATTRLDLLLRRLDENADWRSPIALLPCPSNPPSFDVAGTPRDGESGVRQLLDGAPAEAAALFNDRNEFASTELRLVQPTSRPFEAKISLDGQKVFAGTVAGSVHLSAKGGKLQVAIKSEQRARGWSGEKVVVKSDLPIEAVGGVGSEPAKLLHEWTAKPYAFEVYTCTGETVRAAEEIRQLEQNVLGELPAVPGVLDRGVLLLTCDDSDLRRVFDTLRGRTSVEVVRLPSRPSRADVESAVLRANGRRIALRADYGALEAVVHHLTSIRGLSQTPLAVLPHPKQPDFFIPPGAPEDKETGVLQLLTGEVAQVPILRNDAGEVSLGSVMLSPEESLACAARIWIDDEKVFDGRTDWFIDLSIDDSFNADNGIEVEFRDDSDDEVKRSGKTVTIESPTPLGAATVGGRKTPRRRHTWKVDLVGFSLYVLPEPTKSSSSPNKIVALLRSVFRS